jgi:hypothetical protein
MRDEEGVRLPPCTPLSSAVNMRSVHTHGSVQDQRARTSPTGVALTGTRAGVPSVDVLITHPPSCTPSLDGRYPASTLLWVL